MSNRDSNIAHLYHESTKLFYLELHKKPPASKLYRELSLLPLPTDFSLLAVPALEAIAATGQTAHLTPALDLTMLARLLFFSAGRIKKRTFAGVGEVSFRAAASAGGLYPVEAYVVCGDLPGLAAGVYHFSPADFALRGLRQGDYRPILAQAAAGDPTVATAPCTLVFSAIFWRSAWKYRVRSYRYCFWDNGTIVANLLAASSALALPARVVMGFVDAQANHLLGLDGHREASTCLVSIGPPVDLPPLEHPGQVLPLVAETVPPTRVEVDYPEMTRLHAASTLTTPEEVMAWRAPHMRQPEQNVAPQHLLHPLDAATAPSPSLGDVIRQRGSTRRFAREPMSFAQLSAILSAATTGIPADFLGQGGESLLDIYLIVHAVTGLPAGSYVFTPQAQALELLTAGAYRDAAGHLCFEQALGADASVVVFFLADLADVLQRFGNRGYRAVQLEAGAVGGKMYLGAGALGLGASGLTFYDDEVTAFFAPHAAGKSPIFVVALGHTARENRVQPFRSRAAMAIDAMSRRDF
jgi:SagB-type dehydrogenase family enzyme